MRPARLLSIWLCCFGAVALSHGVLTYVTHHGGFTASGLAAVGAMWIGVGSYRVLRDGAEDWPDSYGSWAYVAAILLSLYVAFVAYAALT